MSCHAAMCTRPAPSPSTARPGLRIAPPEAETEREADRIADAAMSRSGAASPPAQVMPGVIHRQCAACAVGGPACADCDKETLHLQRGDAAPGATSQSAPQAAAAALSGGGRPLPKGLRSHFEPRIGADLAGVRLHTDAAVGRAARGIDARAYTVGRDIGFAPGAYAPDTFAGQRLLAHEIAHAVRHSPGGSARGEIHRQVRSRRFADRAGGGTTDFEETVEEEPIRSGNLVQGTVRRREFAPPRGEEAEEEIHDADAFVSFNSATCEVVLPFRFGFRQRSTDPNGNSCQDPAPGVDVDPLPQTTIDEIATTYVDAVNRGLNRRFTARISGCENDCADRDIPIRVRASRDDIEPDRVITIVPRGGRGDAATLCARSFDRSFAVHEAGHQILGMGDQYREKDEAVRRRTPEWARDERVRTDYPVMGSDSSYGRFAIFHERDFRHVQVFLEAAFPGCTVALSPVPDIVLDYRVILQGGVGRLGGASAFRVGGGFEIGIPLQRDRSWSLLVGAQASYLEQLSEPRRRLVLAGMRLGFERRFTTEWGGGHLFLGGEGGVSRELETTTFGGRFAEPPVTHGPRTSAYAGAEVGAGIDLGHAPSTFLNLRLGAGGELTNQEEAMRWFTAGIDIGWRF